MGRSAKIELYMCYLGRDSRAGEVAFDQEKATNLALQAKLESINREHGDAYIEGIQPRFGILKAHHFDSSWNWVRQDTLLMYYDIIFGQLTTVNQEITARCIALLNRADPDMLQFMQYNINQCDASKGETYRDDVLKLWSIVKALPEISSDQKNHIKSLYEGVVRSLNNPDSNPSHPILHCCHSPSQFLQS